MSKSGSLLPVIILTVAAFVFNASEFAPIGILSSIAADLSRSESEIGFLISVYAWVVMIMSLPLMVLLSRLEYKRLMIGVLALFTASHALSGFASGYGMLMVSRVGVACSHAVFWSIATPLAVKAAPRGKKSTAMSLIVAGSSIAQILGMPLCRVVGLSLGWRYTFLLLGAIAAVVLIMLCFLFPQVDNDSDFSIRHLPRIFRNRRLLTIYITIIAFVLGHFTVYSYIEPYLLNEAAMDEHIVTGVLIMFGIAGIAASSLFSAFYPGKRRLLVYVSSFFLPFVICLLQFVKVSLLGTVVTCVVWGTAMTLINMILQARLMKVERRATTIAMSLYSGLYNLGIGGGAAIGGYICNQSGIGAICNFGALIALAGSVLFTVQYRK